MWFEEALNRTPKKVEKQKKLRMRRKIRDEIFLLLTWEKPTPSAIIKRWEDRMFDVFQIMPFGFKFFKKLFGCDLFKKLNIFDNFSNSNDHR